MTTPPPIPREVLEAFGNCWAVAGSSAPTREDLAAFSLALMDALEAYLDDPDIHGHQDLDDVARALLGREGNP